MTDKTDPRKMWFAGHGLWYLLKQLNGTKATILDVGAGNGAHAKVMREHGHTVHTIDRNAAFKPDHLADFITWKPPKKYAAVWCSHVLEHQLNPGLFLDAISDCLKVGGLLVITVPPCKQEVVGGHVTLWNPALLVYHLVLAGFDCSQAVVQSYGYNITVAVRKKKADVPVLAMDNGDIERIAQFFPVPFEHGQDGWIEAGTLE